MKDIKTQRQIDGSLQNQNRQAFTGNIALVTSYIQGDHTANVILSKQNSNNPGEILNNVPCPYIPGLQYAAPEPGRLCWVQFRGANRSNPVITHFFSPSYNRVDSQAHNESQVAIPRFMVDM